MSVEQLKLQKGNTPELRKEIGHALTMIDL